jgi:hypothetical protein
MNFPRFSEVFLEICRIFEEIPALFLICSRSIEILKLVRSLFIIFHWIMRLFGGFFKIL